VMAKGPFKPASMAALSTPLLFDPGEQWQYSISIDWAGLMVEAASGKRLDRYMTENIFTPLGMADTGFAISPAMRPRKAAVHVRKEEGGFEATDHELNQTPEVFQGGGALYSTVPDYLRFTRAFLNGGAPILKPTTVVEMFRNSMNEGVLCQPLKTQIPGRSADMDFVVGPHLHDQPHGLSRSALGPEPDLGRSRQLLLLDRPREEGHRRVGNAAAAVL
jgi:methyl acetate hydrolase